MTERELRMLCAERNIRIERTGRTWRFVGPGIDSAVSDLRYVSRDDFTPERVRGAGRRIDLPVRLAE